MWSPHRIQYFGGDNQCKPNGQQVPFYFDVLRMIEGILSSPKRQSFQKFDHRDQASAQSGRSIAQSRKRYPPHQDRQLAVESLASYRQRPRELILIDKPSLINYNYLMVVRPILKLLFLILICSSTDLINSTISETNIIQAQNIFREAFCSQCTTPETHFICNKNIDYVSSLPQTGYFNLSADPISKNPYNVTKILGLTFETTQTYAFPKMNISKNHSSIVYYPSASSGRVKLRGAILYFHPTTLGKWNPPSSNTKQYRALAALYVSQGYALVIPDLTGFRSDEDPHPYCLYPQASVRSAVTTLNNLVSFFKLFGSAKLPLYSVGYSQGGSYALWLSKCLNFPIFCFEYTRTGSYYLEINPFYTLKAVSGLQGALDFLDVMYQFLTEPTGRTVKSNKFKIEYQSINNLAKGPLVVAVMDSYIYYNLGKKNQLINYLEKEFFLMDCTLPLNQSLCDIQGKHYNLTSAMNSHFNEANISAAISVSSFGKRIQPYPIPYLGSKPDQYLFGENNSIYSLANNTIVNSTQFQTALRLATIVDYAKYFTSPVFVFTLAFDSVVTGMNSRKFFDIGVDNKNVSFYQFDNDKYHVCDFAGFKLGVPVDHIRAQILANIFALNYIQMNP